MIKVTIKLEDFMDDDTTPYNVTETVSTVHNDKIDGVLLAMVRTLQGATFGDGLIQKYINYDEENHEVYEIEEVEDEE